MKWFFIFLSTLALLSCIKENRLKKCLEHTANSLTVRSQTEVEMWRDTFTKTYRYNCGCKSDSLITEYTTSCDTIVLKNKSRLYYQFNCDSIWLTLENNNKHIIFSSTTQFYAYTYRLGYRLSKEFDKYLLFRSGCGANGPCNFVLIDKQTGLIKEQFGELIYDHNAKEFNDFVMYLSGKNIITLYFIDRNKRVQIPIDSSGLSPVNPEYQFENIRLDNNILTMEYPEMQMEEDALKLRRINKINIDLKKYQ